MAPDKIQLPVSVSSPGDVNRLIRELASIDEQLLQLRVRAAGSDVKLPKTSRLMDQTLSLNDMNLLQTADRQRLQQILQAVHERAPVLHLSFSVDPSPTFMTKLLTWLRREIHPFVLVTTGLQVNIGAGCVVRTVNRSFDLSLYQRFSQQRQLLIDKLATPAPDVSPTAPAPPVAAPAASPAAEAAP